LKNLLSNTTKKPMNKKYIFILRDGLRYEVDQNTYDYFISCSTMFDIITLQLEHGRVMIYKHYIQAIEIID
jgi:hypothetical protein